MHFLVFPSLSAKAFILKLDLITSLAFITLMRKETTIVLTLQDIAVMDLDFQAA